MMKLLKESLPKDNIVLDNYYLTKLARSLGFPVEKINYCDSGCMLLRGNNEHFTSCKILWP